MSEKTKMIEPAPPRTATEPESFQDVVRALVGKTVTMVNPESFEDAPVGHRLATGFYRAKVLSVGSDYVCLAVEYVRQRGEKGKEPVKQFIPLSKIKRVSVMKSDRLIHI